MPACPPSGDADIPAPSGSVPVRDAPRTVESQHLRAARALLGWAMSDLATVSGLSLSTIRRLEQSTQTVSLRNYQAAVEALRLGGIRFFTLEDGTTALAERPQGSELPPWGGGAATSQRNDGPGATVRPADADRR